MRYVKFASTCDWLARCLATAIVVCGALALALSTTVSTALRLSANALIMDATTFPTPSPGYLQSAIDDLIVPTVGGTYSAIPVTTPEGVVGINQSVRDGLGDLETAMAEQQRTSPGSPYVVFGFSQSTVIQTYEMQALAQRRAAGQAVPPVTFVGIGVGNRPNGGIASRLDGLVIPFFDFTFNGAAPTDTGFRSIDIARQYDGLADTPQFVTNPVALANAVLGVLFTHAFYGEEVSLDPSSPKYVQGTVEQQRGNTTYYWIPTADLPLFDPLRLLGVPEGVLDIAEPFVKTLVEAGYDRSVPFGQPTPAQLIPVIDPVTFGLQLTGAVLEGADNAAKLVGGALPGYAGLSSAVQELEKVSAEAIGRPYGDVVRSINNAFNPIVAFNRIEGPIVTAIDSVVNATGLPRLLNQAIGSVLFPLTAWAERNVLFPESDTAGGPLAAAARQALEPVLPHLADKRAAPEQAQALEPVLPQRAIAHKWDAHRSDGTKRDDQRDDQKKDSDADEVSPAKKPLTNDGKPARKPGHQPHADKPRRADKPRPRHEKRDADDHKRSESGVSSG